MNKLILSFICITLLLCSGIILAEDSGVSEDLGLAECIEYALKYHPDIESAKFTLFEAETELKRLKLEDPRTIAQKEYEDAEQVVEQAKESLREACMNLALNVENKYYQILKEIQTVNNTRLSQERAEKQMAIVEIKFDNGLIPKKEFETMQKSLQDAKKAYNQALFGLETMRMELNLTIGRDIDVFFTLKDKEFVFEPLEIDLETVTEFALEHSKDIKSSRDTLNQAKEDLELVRQTEASELDILKAEHQLKMAEISLQRTRQQVIIQIRSQVMGFQSSKDEIEEVNQDLEEARNNLQVLSLKYEAGLVSLSQLLEGEQTLKEAEIECVQVIYDYNLAKASFNQSIGKDYSLYQSIVEEGSDK